MKDILQATEERICRYNIMVIFQCTRKEWRGNERGARLQVLTRDELLGLEMEKLQIQTGNLWRRLGHRPYLELCWRR